MKRLVSSIFSDKQKVTGLLLISVVISLLLTGCTSSHIDQIQSDMNMHEKPYRVLYLIEGVYSIVIFLYIISNYTLRARLKGRDSIKTYTLFIFSMIEFVVMFLLSFFLVFQYTVLDNSAWFIRFLYFTWIIVTTLSEVSMYGTLYSKYSGFEKNYAYKIIDLLLIKSGEFAIKTLACKFNLEDKTDKK